MKCNKQLKYSNYVAFSHFHGTSVNNSGLTSDSKDIVAMMCFAEVYNGLGYYNNGHISPYLYSGTNLYVSGKYVEERNAEGKYISVYKKDVVDAQIGVYILLNSILDQEVE